MRLKSVTEGFFRFPPKKMSLLYNTHPFSFLRTKTLSLNKTRGKWIELNNKVNLIYLIIKW